jgi:hypothetical protein
MSIQPFFGATPHERFVVLSLGATLFHPVAAIGGLYGTVKREFRFAYRELKNDSDPGAICVICDCDSIFHKRHSLFKKALFDSRKNGCTTSETALYQ